MKNFIRNYSLAIMCGLLSFSTSVCAMPSSRVHSIYNKIIRANHIKHAPILKVVRDGDINASTDGWSEIDVNTGMLRNVRSDSEMALVLGHELGHVLKHDHGSTPVREYAADKQGAIYMSKAGYSICSGAQIIKRFHSSGDDTHPASESRYHRLGCS